MILRQTLSGEVDLAVQQEPEVISVAGVDLVGSLPPGLNNITTYAAGVGAGSKETETAKALLTFLHSPQAQAVFKARGLKPA
jgi:molybdate transport system substrate-binding protein